MEELQLKQKSLKQDLQRLLDEKEDIVREKEEMNIKVPINKKDNLIPQQRSPKTNIKSWKECQTCQDINHDMTT